MIEPLLKKIKSARLLNMSESWLEKATANGELPAVHLGRSVRYDPADLRAWLESKKNAFLRWRAVLKKNKSPIRGQHLG